MADRNLSDLDPTFRPIAQEILDQANVALAVAVPSATVRPIVTWRDGADQMAAKCDGESKAGQGQSPHNCVDAAGKPAARAFDFGIFRPDGSYVTNGTDWRYALVGEIAAKLGQIWGGNWTPATDDAGPDYDHIELPEWKNV